MYIPERRDGPEGLTFDVATRPHPQLPILPIVIAVLSLLADHHA